MKKLTHQILKVSAICLCFTGTTYAQNQTINGNLYIGNGSHDVVGFGPKIYFLGNSDNFSLGRYNSAGNQSEFRFEIGDDFQPEDKFSIGVNWAGDGHWYEKFVVQGDGNVGIGTATPLARLQVDGGAAVVGTNAVKTNTDGNLSIGNINANANPTQSNWVDNSTLLLNGQDFSAIAFHDSGVRVDFIRAGNGTIQLGYDGGFGNAHIGLPMGIWNAQGNVGIGTTNPLEKLSVKGKIRAQEVKVEMDNWPDYVFDRKYSLMPLNELGTYVNNNKHLPGIPSVNEVKQEGVELGEMNKKLLQKIEELTLYLIEQDKRISQQEKKAIEANKNKIALERDLSVIKTQLKSLKKKAGK